MTEPLTPVGVEQKLRELVNAIYKGQRALADARNKETEADLARKRAVLTWANHDGAPRPTRGGVTVSQRQEWIDSQTFDETEQLHWATTGREIAQDALRAHLAVAEVVRSLAASVRTAYEMAGKS